MVNARFVCSLPCFNLAPFTAHFQNTQQLLDSNTTVTLKGQAEERKSSSEACKTCSMRVQRPSLRQVW